jgi:predicted membrane-bound spermidine synthase
MLLTAALLMAVSAAYFFTCRREKALSTSVALILGIGLGVFAGYRTYRPQFEHVEELARCNSNFGLLQVIQDKEGPRRYYLNDYLTQNIYDADQKRSAAMFTYTLHHLARAYTPAIQDVLCIGLGVGIVPMEFAREGARVEVVEINPAVVPLAREFFSLEPARLQIHYGDGRYFLNQTTQRYDTVILDAFLGDSSPSHLMTREAFGAIRRVLKPRGTLVINSFGNLEPGNDFFTASLYRTLTNAFASVRMHCQSDEGNTFFVASDQRELTILHPPDLSDVHPDCLGPVRAALDGLREPLPGHGRVLTDDYNPVDFYDAANRELNRRRLAMGVRSL